MINVQCPVCGAEFEVKNSLKGGSVNCRECRELVEVPGSDAYDTLFKTGIGLAAAFVVAIGCVLLFNGNVGVGLTVLGLAAFIGLVLFLGL